MELPIKHKRGTTVPTANDLVVGELAINTESGVVYTKTDAGVVMPISGGGGGSWGGILGNLADQTDLQAALDAKYDASNPAGFFIPGSGDLEIGNYSLISTSGGATSTIGPGLMAVVTGGENIGQTSYTSTVYQTEFRTKTTTFGDDGTGDPYVTSFKQSSLLSVGQSLVFTDFSLGTGTRTASYGFNGITFKDTTVQTTAFPGFNDVALTGASTASTPTLSDSSDRIATTDFVQGQGYAKVDALYEYLRADENLAGLYDPDVARSNLGIGTTNSVVFGSVSCQDITGYSYFGPSYVSVTENAIGTISLTASAGITFPDGTSQSTAATTVSLAGYATENFVTSRGYITSAALSGYATESWVTSRGYLVNGSNGTVPAAGTTGQVLTKSSNTNYQYTWSTPVVGDRYLTTSTTSNTIGNGAKTFTVGTGLSYTPTQDVTIVYDAANHMHGTVTTYNSTTGSLVVDISNHTGSGTYNAWTVNVGGTVPAATAVSWGNITGTLAAQTDLQNALNERASLYSPTFYQGVSLNAGDFSSYRVDPSGIGNNDGGWQAYARLENNEFGGGANGYSTHYTINSTNSGLDEQTQSWAISSQGASFNSINGASWYLKEDGVRFSDGTLQSTAFNGSLYAAKSGAVFTGDVYVDHNTGYPLRVTPNYDRNQGVMIGSHVRVGLDPAFYGVNAANSMIGDNSWLMRGTGGQYIQLLMDGANPTVNRPVLKLMASNGTTTVSLTEVRDGRIFYNSAELYASASSLGNYALLTGATFSGKVNFASVAGAAGVNIGIGGTSTTATTPGDLWITTGGANLNFRDGTGAWKILASLQNGNAFTQPQSITTPTTATAPALRVTNQATSSTVHSFVVDDASSDTSSFIINSEGQVGIGYNANTTLWNPTIYKLQVNGLAWASTPSAASSSGEIATTSHVKSVVQGFVQEGSSAGFNLPYYGVPNVVFTILEDGATGSGQVVVPSEYNVSIPIGVQYVFIQTGTIPITIVPDGNGCSISSFGNKFTTGGQYAVCTLIKTAENTWYLAGNLV